MGNYVSLPSSLPCSLNVPNDSALLNLDSYTTPFYTMTRMNTSHNTLTANAVHNDAPQTPGLMLPFSTMTVQHLLNGGINMTEVNLTGLPGDAAPVQSPYVS